MRVGVAAFVLSAFLGVAPMAAAQAADEPSFKGIWVSTPYPAFDTAAGATLTLNLTVHNAGLPPQVVRLAVKDDASRWSAAFIGEDKRVQSVFVAPNSTASVKLRLEPKKAAEQGTQTITVVATGKESRFDLPIELTIGESLPPKLSVTPELPALRGSPNSDFDFKVAIRNDGGEDATVRVDAKAPPKFRVKITEEYGSQELTSLPVKVGEEKTVTVKVTPAFNTEKGTYPVAVRVSSGKAAAETRLTMEVTGAPDLKITGVGERLSASAEAGDETPVEVVLSNHGSAPARDIKLRATPPTGWKVAFRPSEIDSLAPDATETVQALVTPSRKAIAGDYMVPIRAESGGTNESSDFRITVRTSTLWGIVGVLVIGAALVILVAAMMRYGRR